MTINSENTLAVVVLIAMLLVGWFLVLTLLIWTICWAFGLTFLWSYTFGVMAAGMLVKSIK